MGLTEKTPLARKTDSNPEKLGGVEKWPYIRIASDWEGFYQEGREEQRMPAEEDLNLK